MISVDSTKKLTTPPSFFLKQIIFYLFNSQVFLGAGTCLLAFSAIPDSLAGGGGLRGEGGGLQGGEGGLRGGEGGLRGGEGGGHRVGMLVSVLCFGQALAIAISLLFISHQAGVAG